MVLWRPKSDSFRDDETDASHATFHPFRPAYSVPIHPITMQDSSVSPGEGDAPLSIRPPGRDTPMPVNKFSDSPKIIPFQDLARCGEEIWIENEGQIYRLRKTKQGKLILTK